MMILLIKQLQLAAKFLDVDLRLRLRPRERQHDAGFAAAAAQMRMRMLVVDRHTDRLQTFGQLVLIVAVARDLKTHRMQSPQNLIPPPPQLR